MFHNHSFPLLIWPQSERVGQKMVGNAGSRELWHIWLQEAINLVSAARSLVFIVAGNALNLRESAATLNSKFPFESVCGVC